MFLCLKEKDLCLIFLSSTYPQIKKRCRLWKCASIFYLLSNQSLYDRMPVDYPDAFTINMAKVLQEGRFSVPFLNFTSKSLSQVNLLASQRNNFRIFCNIWHFKLWSQQLSECWNTTMQMTRWSKWSGGCSGVNEKSNRDYKRPKPSWLLNYKCLVPKLIQKRGRRKKSRLWRTGWGRPWSSGFCWNHDQAKPRSITLWPRASGLSIKVKSLNHKSRKSKARAQGVSFQVGHCVNQDQYHHSHDLGPYV